MAAAIAPSAAAETVVWASARMSVGVPDGVEALRVPQLRLPLKSGLLTRRGSRSEAVDLLVGELGRIAAQMG